MDVFTETLHTALRLFKAIPPFFHAFDKSADSTLTPLTASEQPLDKLTRVKGAFQMLAVSLNFNLDVVTIHFHADNELALVVVLLCLRTLGILCHRFCNLRRLLRLLWLFTVSLCLNYGKATQCRAHS